MLCSSNSKQFLFHNWKFLDTVPVRKRTYCLLLLLKMLLPTVLSQSETLWYGSWISCTCSLILSGTWFNMQCEQPFWTSLGEELQATVMREVHMEQPWWTAAADSRLCLTRVQAPCPGSKKTEFQFLAITLMLNSFSPGRAPIKAEKTNFLSNS